MILITTDKEADHNKTAVIHHIFVTYLCMTIPSALIGIEDSPEKMDYMNNANILPYTDTVC